MAKCFLRSVKGDASLWFYTLYGKSIDSFKILVKTFMAQYNHNIKEQSKVHELCALQQGSNETLEKYILCFKKVCQSIWSKLDEHKIYTIFCESIIPIRNLHAPSAKDFSFSILVQHLLQKEKVLLALGELKYAPNPFFKNNWKP